MLLHGEALVLGEPEGGLVIDASRKLATVVGRPGMDLIEEARSHLLPGAELLVTSDDFDHLHEHLLGLTAEKAIIHALANPLPTVEVRDVDVAEVDDSFLSRLPPQLAPEADGAFVAATREVDGMVVALCTAGSITETLWDPGIDTIEAYQRQGHARACFLALARHLDPLIPIWGALDDNAASLGMAAGLGFEPVDELWVVTIPR